MPHLYPAILTDLPETFQTQLDLVKADGRLPVVQVDVIDGEFADAVTLSIHEMTEFDFGSLRIDLHLMTQEPIAVVQELAELDQQLPVRRIIGQVEHMHSQRDFVEEVRSLGIEPALALDIFTPLEAVEDDVWSDLQAVQLMANEAGEQGKEIHPHFWPKLQQLVGFCQRQGLELEKMVDIGVKQHTLDQLLQTGAQGLCVGSALWTAPDFSKTLSEFLECLGYNDTTP